MRVRVQGAALQFPRLLSPEAKDLLEKALSRDPAARPSLDEMLSHQWLVAAEVGRQRTLLGQRGGMHACMHAWQCCGWVGWAPVHSAWWLRTCMRQLPAPMAAALATTSAAQSM